VRVSFGAIVKSRTGGLQERAQAMMDSTQRSHKRVEITVPLLFVGGAAAALLGVAILAISRSGAAGLPLLFGGLGVIGFAQLLELLCEIAGHLGAIRAQMNKGVLGLLG
jgi:hypothetical protein